MHIEITDQFLAGMKRDLAALKQAQKAASDIEVVPAKMDRIDMQNMLTGGIVTLQQLVELCEKQER